MKLDGHALIQSSNEDGLTLGVKGGLVAPKEDPIGDDTSQFLSCHMPLILFVKRILIIIFFYFSLES